MNGSSLFKSIFISAALIAALALNVPARADLLGYWPLDGSAKAAVGIEGFLSGQPAATTDRRGNSSGALAFDGAKQQYVSILGGSGLNGLARGTISLWVKWDADGQDAGPGNTLFGTVLGRQKNGHWSSNLLGLSGPDPGRASVRWRPGYKSAGPLDNRSSPGIGRWHHVPVTFKPDEHVLFVDGQQEAKNTETHPLDNDFQCPLTIGAWIGDGNCYATASVDDVAIWDQVLEPAPFVAELTSTSGYSGENYVHV